MQGHSQVQQPIVSPLFLSLEFWHCRGVWLKSPTDPINGKRNRTYTDAVRSLLGRKNVICCGVVQYIMLWGTMIGYTITTVVSIGTLEKTVCFRTKGHNAACRVDATPYMLGFGAIQILLSQFPNLEEITIISVIATITSFIYATVALTLCIVRLYFDPQIRGNMMGAATVEGIVIDQNLEDLSSSR
ncbi:hypothetical protein ACFE04_007790 [Oxalis oulophora]